MLEVQSPSPIGADRGTATVVFIRPDEVEWGVVLPIIDETNHFYGEISAKSHLVARVPAGHHVFASWIRYGGSEDALTADLVAGKVYYVRAVARFMGGWHGHACLTAIKPDSQEWSLVKGFLAQTALVELRPEEANHVRAMEADRKAGWEERSKAGLDYAAKLPPSDQAAHALAAGDSDPVLVAAP
jgi:hypothetical protein